MLERIVEEIQKEKNLILMHQNADGDAIASAIALKLSFPYLDIGIFNGISKIAKKILAVLDCEILEKPDINNYDKIIVLDTSSPSQLEITLETDKYIVIDHHTKSDFWEHPLFYYCDETKSSCSEIIYQILKIAKLDISDKIATALICGIITDTSHFRFSTHETFLIVSKIINESNINIQDVLSIIEEGNFEKSKKIAHLKALQRLKYKVVDDNVIAYTKLNSFEGSASKALLSIGADISFVGSQQDGEARISGRAKNFIAKDIHLGKFMIELGEEYNGEGGGHAGAGGLSCPGDVDILLIKCVMKMKKKLEQNTYN